MINAWKAALLVTLISFCAAGMTAQVAIRKADGDKKEEKKEEKKEITEAAKKALTKLAGDAKLKTEAAGANWKGEWEVDDKDHEAIVDAEGKVLRTESEVDAKDVPEAVCTAATTKFGEDVFVEFTKITKGDKVIYEVDSKKGEAHFDAQGAVVADDDDEDDDDGEDDDDDEGDDD